ncbi:hypothetical protein TNCV_4760881 [Trichonephila clavipes]|uniref:Uncharacterized protein n=1 Tax=Trichonephila clavipes TaxID=2585209 RepID=A0A8X6V4U8_TRICX|nr:hypothetical protein TNCV_4760881 [Trichonephila clavipes]
MTHELAVSLLASTPVVGCLRLDRFNVHQPSLHGGSSVALDSNSWHAGLESGTFTTGLQKPLHWLQIEIEIHQPHGIHRCKMARLRLSF